MPKQPLSEEAKKALLARLHAGRAKVKAARDEAKSKGLPDPKPRKPRKKKAAESHDGAVQEPLAAKPANDTIPGIDSAKPNSVVAETPVKAQPVETKPIDVPALPKDKKDVVQNAEKKPKARAKTQATDSAGTPAKIQQNQLLTNSETGDQTVSVQFAGQRKSIQKALKKNKELHPETPGESSQAARTTDNMIKHVPDRKALEAAPSVPFSFQAARKVLFQF